jgi:hypothetical protein
LKSYLEGAVRVDHVAQEKIVVNDHQALFRITGIEGENRALEQSNGSISRSLFELVDDLV